MQLETMSLLTALREKLRSDMNNFTDDMASGQCADHAAYKELCGVIRGLAYAERYLLDLADNLERANDE